MKSRMSSDKTLLFWCPGCNCAHGVNTDPNKGGPCWDWNGLEDKPTIKPSILVQGVRPLHDDEEQRLMGGEHIEPTPSICHSFVTCGFIEFLTDCTHDLAGQTVELPDFDKQ